MAEETTPTPEADPAGESTEGVQPQPEAAAASEELEEAPLPEEPPATDAELIGEAPEPKEDAAAEGETPAPAAAEAPAAEEEPEEEEEPAYPAGAFKVGLFLTILAIGGISYIYLQAFFPKLKEAATLKEEYDSATKGNATAQYQLATNYLSSYDKSNAKGLPNPQMLIQAYAWMSLAARTHKDADDSGHEANDVEHSKPRADGL